MSDLDPKRLKVLIALSEHISKSLNGSAPYTHDIGGRVYRGRGRFSEEEQVPAINILEPLNPDREPGDIGGDERVKQKEDWVLLIQGWSEDDKKNPTDPAHRLMADVKLCLSKIALEAAEGKPANKDFMLGGLISDFRMEPGTCRPPDEISAAAFFYMRVVLEVVESVFDPFDTTIS